MIWNLKDDDVKSKHWNIVCEQLDNSIHNGDNGKCEYIMLTVSSLC